MKSSLLPWLGVVLIAFVSFAVGRSTAPGLRQTAPTIEKPRLRVSASVPASEATSAGPDAVSPRFRSPNRRDVTRAGEPRVSLPFKTVVDLLKKDLEHQDITSLDRRLDNALLLLGLNSEETSRVKAVFSRASEEVAAAEKAHVKIAETTQEKLRLDLSAMAGPVKKIIAETQDEIRAELPGDIAEGLLAAIDWERYYTLGKSSQVTFEIIRTSTGLTAWEQGPRGGTGSGVDKAFPNDGSALPADQIYLYSRWKPFLQGVTLVPRDD